MSKRKFGDRFDGRRLRKIPAMQITMAHLYPKRTENEAYLQDDIDVTELLKYLDKVNAAHPEYKTTVFQALIFAASKMVYERPRMNWFVQGHRYYERNDISAGFVARRKFEDKSEETLMFFRPQPEDTLDSLSKLIGTKVKKSRTAQSKGDVNSFMEFTGKMPVILYMFFIRIVRYLDFWGIEPKVLTNGDPNFATLFLANLGSVGCPSVYHHLNNYGTNSCMIAMGIIHKKEIIMPDGHKEIRDVVDVGCTVDERIADGFYFARSLRLVKHLFAHPEMMEQSISTPSNLQYESKKV